MPLTLAVAGLSASEKGALVAAIKAQSHALSTAWTLFWDPSQFPERPDGLLYCAKREEGRLWAARLGRGPCLLLAALPPDEATPSEVPLFVRMPFAPQAIVEALNIAAQRVFSAAPAESASAPAGAEERVEARVDFRGASRVDPFALLLFAVFHGGDRTRFYKLRQLPSPARPCGVELWCWPDLNQYWSEASEAQILAAAAQGYDVFNCRGKPEALAQKSDLLRPAGPLLWRAGSRAFKTSELLPWLAPDQKIALRRWPELPAQARTPSVLRALRRLCQADASFAELLRELGMGRKDLSAFVNALLLSGDGTRAGEPRGANPPARRAHERADPEQELFLAALSLRCADALAAAQAGADS
jgi:hypothetical protein